METKNRRGEKERRAINIKFIMHRSKFLQDEKATYFPRTRQVLIEYSI